MYTRSLLKQITPGNHRLVNLGIQPLRLPPLVAEKRYQTAGSDRPPTSKDPPLSPPDLARPSHSRPNERPLDQFSSSAGPSRIPLGSSSTNPGPPDGVPSNSRLQRYLPRLHALSVRTGTPLPSLGISLLLLHELTAILPLVLFFWVFQVLGLGAGIVTWLVSVSSSPKTDSDSGANGWDWRETVGKWMEEGSKRVEKVGKRYGILGYEKVDKSAASQIVEVQASDSGAMVVQEKRGGEVAEKVASAIAAYVVVKALLPVRIAASIGLAPAFARFALNPIQRLAMRFRR